MTLSELTKYKNALTKVKTKLSLEHSIDYKSNYIKYLEVNFANPDYDRHLRVLRIIYEDISTANLKISTEIDSLLEKLDSDINDTASRLLFADWDINLLNLGQCVKPEDIDEHILERIKTRIKGYCDWHYPALQIGSRFKYWVDCMVTADPLYITNNYHEYLNSIVTEYHPSYQNRIRAYEYDILELLDVLPLNQFSFVLCWDTFNYSKQAQVEVLLTQVKQLLRPGGTFMFSYNNCDTVQGAHLADNLCMSYLNRSRLLEIIHQLGYEIVADESHKNSHNLYKNISWLELKLPGTLATSKAHQVLGEIMEK